MRPFILTGASLMALALLAPGLAAAQAPQPIVPPASAPVPPPASLPSLVASVDIPYTRFTLKNGLTVLVHTDRKAPIVGVTTYYRVGSKNEPRGHTGFAHLYEHLFFGGSANVPNFDVPLEAAGSTATNGSTWYDRTNYVETVPKGALPLALFIESDRMGHLLPAVTQDKLDKQRGVVENEKRQGDNQPYGLLQYIVSDALFPIGHPYRHTTIGSMQDLDAATLTDVRQWFTGHYAPGNVVLVLSGDIDEATARPLVEKYFADIPAGPKVAPVAAGPVTLPAPVRREITDNVATTRLYRSWSGPGTNDPDAMALAVGMDILGGLASSRLDNALVRGQQLAVGVTAEDEQHEAISVLSASMDVKPGTDRAAAEAAFDAEIARFLSEGPTADEVRRSATRTLSSQIDALQVVGGMGGKGATLAEGLLYSNDPARYKVELQEIASLTPAQVQAAMRKWLGRPAVQIVISPGKRTLSGDSMGGWGDEGTHPAPPADPHKPVAPVAAGPKRVAPAVAPVGALAFPAVQRARLSNGIVVTLARRTAIPKLSLSIGFDAGIAADALDTPGTQGLMLAMLKEGTRADADGGTARTTTQLLEAEERLGASIASSASMDQSGVSLNALTANLAPSLDLLGDVVRHPAFAPADVERVKNQRQAALAQTLASPQGMALRAISPLLFGAGHPYRFASDGLGDAASLARLDAAALHAAHDRWLRPDLARITVVGDITMEQLLPQLERVFGHWAAPATPRPVKAIDAAVPAPSPRIVLIDRPDSPQSVIVGGRVLPVTGRAPNQEALDLANEVLGSDFLSRLNLDIREEKSWSYGVQTVLRRPLGARSLLVFAPVQTDRTGDSIKAIMADMAEFPAKKPVAAEELQRVTDGNIRSLPSSYETNGQVLGAITTNDVLGRPDNYMATLADRFRAVTAQRIDTAAREYLQPGGLIYVVVG
ncbi:MAG TPA: pitrilysin family protein, partial [Novosphingobium sp.]|nr:pitrilysin family protein [Novosphingobium sp.]